LLIQNGRVDYGRVLTFQRAWAEALNQELVPPLVWIGRHDPVVTIGKRGDEKELKYSPAELKRQGIEVHHIERGGLATVHGPGQLVAYPIWPFKSLDLGVKEYVYVLEEAMIQVLAELGLAASRNELNPGAWVGAEKIGFVGLAIRHGVFFHGLALNLNLDLGLFGLIIPCGLDRVGITSAKKLLGQPVDMDAAGRSLAEKLARLMGFRPTLTSLAEAEARLLDLAPRSAAAQEG
jgi:lipoate-protein ligase B